MVSYKDFKLRVNALAQKAGGITVNYRKIPNGFCALCSDGTEIIGYTSVLKVTVRWGGTNKNHQALAEI